MKVVVPGHVYAVHNVDGPPESVQTIEFVRRCDQDATLLPGEARLPGILAQELLRVLIDRTLYLNAEAPCIEDVMIVGRLRESLRLYEARAARRVIEKLPMPEMQDVCARCHHILCLCDHPSRIEHGIDR